MSELYYIKTFNPERPGTVVLFEGYKCNQCGEIHATADSRNEIITWFEALSLKAKQVEKQEVKPTCDEAGTAV